MKKSHLLGAVCACMFSLVTSSANSAIVSVEPDGFLSGTDISTAFSGVSLSVVGNEVNAGITVPEVFSIWSPSATTGTQLFGNSFGPNLYTQGWSEAERALRVDLDFSTNFISIDMRGQSNAVGVVHAYNSLDVEVASYTTAPLTSLTTFEIAIISISSAEISYLIIGGVNTDVVRLDNLQISAIPIPPALWLFGSGLLGLIGIARKKTG